MGRLPTGEHDNAALRLASVVHRKLDELQWIRGGQHKPREQEDVSDEIQTVAKVSTEDIKDTAVRVEEAKRVRLELVGLMDKLDQEIDGVASIHTSMKDSEELQTEVDQLRQHLRDKDSTLSKLQLMNAELVAEVQEQEYRMSRNDIQMEFMKKQVMQRNETLNEQRRTFYRELVDLKEQLFRKADDPSRFHPDVASLFEALVRAEFGDKDTAADVAYIEELAYRGQTQVEVTRLMTIAAKHIQKNKDKEKEKIEAEEKLAVAEQSVKLTLEKEKEMVQDYKRTIIELKEEISQLEKDLFEASKPSELLAKNIQEEMDLQFSVERDVFSKSLAAIEEQVRGEEAKRSDIADELKGLQVSYNQLTDQYQNAMKDMKSMQEVHENHQKTTKKLESVIKAKMMELKDKQNHLVITKEVVFKKEAEMDALKGRIEDMKSEAQALKARIITQTEKNKELEAEIDRLQTTVEAHELMKEQQGDGKKDEGGGTAKTREKAKSKKDIYDMSDVSQLEREDEEEEMKRREAAKRKKKRMLARKKAKEAAEAAARKQEEEKREREARAQAVKLPSLLQKKRRKGENDAPIEQIAATRIQSMFRGLMSRKAYHYKQMLRSHTLDDDNPKVLEDDTGDEKKPHAQHGKGGKTKENKEREREEKTREVFSLNAKGISYLSQANYPASWNCFVKALELTKEKDSAFEERDFLRASTWKNVSCFFFTQKRYEEALQHAFRAFKLQKELGPSRQSASIHLLISSILSQIGKHEQAHQFATRALKVCQITSEEEKDKREQRIKRNKDPMFPDKKVKARIRKEKQDMIESKCTEAMCHHKIAIEEISLHRFEQAYESSKTALELALDNMDAHKEWVSKFRATHSAAAKLSMLPMEFEEEEPHVEELEQPPTNTSEVVEGDKLPEIGLDNLENGKLDDLSLSPSPQSSPNAPPGVLSEGRENIMGQDWRTRTDTMLKAYESSLNRSGSPELSDQRQYEEDVGQDGGGLVRAQSREGGDMEERKGGKSKGGSRKAKAAQQQLASPYFDPAVNTGPSTSSLPNKKVKKKVKYGTTSRGPSRGPASRDDDVRDGRGGGSSPHSHQTLNDDDTASNPSMLDEIDLSALDDSAMMAPDSTTSPTAVLYNLDFSSAFGGPARSISGGLGTMGTPGDVIEALGKPQQPVPSTKHKLRSLSDRKSRKTSVKVKKVKKYPMTTTKPTTTREPKQKEITTRSDGHATTNTINASPVKPDTMSNSPSEYGEDEYIDGMGIQSNAPESEANGFGDTVDEQSDGMGVQAGGWESDENELSVSAEESQDTMDFLSPR